MRYLVLFVIDLQTRRVHIAGIAPTPDGVWMAQVARNLTDAVAGPLRGFRHLIVDRDPLYTKQFENVLASANVGPDGEMMRAVLGAPARMHPSAARTLLEGIALWQQQPLSVVLYVDEPDDGCAMGLLDGLGMGR